MSDFCFLSNVAERSEMFSETVLNFGKYLHARYRQSPTPAPTMPDITAVCKIPIVIGSADFFMNNTTMVTATTAKSVAQPAISAIGDFVHMLNPFTRHVSTVFPSFIVWMFAKIRITEIGRVISFRLCDFCGRLWV